MQNTTTATPPKAQMFTNAATGESVAMVPQDSADAFSMEQYLQAVTSEAAFEHAKALAAAYDKACASLIGPNDEQKEGSRSFKKKSAWRKLQRHFRISTFVRNIRFVEVSALGSVHNGDRMLTIAEVTVEAIAPWGQVTQAVGACGFDEESEAEERPSTQKPGTTYWTKGKELSLADMVATAETRATNRAVSNLIAMGEVSAEEINRRNSRDSAEGGESPQPQRSRGGPSDKQVAYVRNMASSSVIPDAKRAEILATLDKAVAEQWPRERMSAFVDQVKAYFEKRKARAAAAAPEGAQATATASAPASTTDAPQRAADATTTTSSTGTPATPPTTGTADDEPDFETLPRDLDLPAALHDESDDGLPF